MPSPGTFVPPRLPIEDSYFELLADTLESLDLPARGQFLQRYLRAIAHLDLRETQSVQIWDEMLARRRELTDLVGRQVSLKTALTDVLSSSGLLRVPILIEYDELKKLELNAAAGSSQKLSKKSSIARAAMASPWDWLPSTCTASRK